MKPKIRFSRNQEVLEDRNIALIWLDKYNFAKGEPVTVYYREGSDSLGAIFTIGTSNGTGRDKYSIISTESLNTITGIRDIMPDVSEVINGERYLWKNNSGIWCLIKINNITKEIIELSGDYKFKNLEDTYFYYLHLGELTREDEFTTQSFVESKIDKELNKIYKPVITKLEFVGGDVRSSSERVENVLFTINVSDKTGTDVTDKCQISITSDIHGTSESIVWKYRNTYAIVGEVTKTTLYTVKVIYQEETVTKDLKLNIVSECFYGKVSRLAGSNFQQLLAEKDNLSTLLWNCSDPISFETDLNDELTILIVPSIYPELTKIVDVNNFDYIEDYNISEHTLGNNMTYRFYIKKDAVRINKFKQTFTI